MAGYRIRVGVVLIEDGKILLTKMYRENSEDIYVLPGGGIEQKENLIEGAIREVKEETNLDAEIIKTLYLKTLFTEDNNNTLEIIFLGKITGGNLQKGFDPEDKGANVLKEVVFENLNTLKEINFHPKQLKTLLIEDWKIDFSKDTKYLGNFEYPEQ